MLFRPGLFRHISACNACDLTGIHPLVAEYRHLFWPSRAAQTAMASLEHDFVHDGTVWRFAETCRTAQARSTALASVAKILHRSGQIRAPRNELYAVTTEWGAPVACTLDRSASVALGIRAFGVHLNGYVKRPDGIHMWIARRSKTKFVAPGKLDNMVAGGQPARHGLLENLIKECAEEASISRDLASRAVPVGLVRYCFSTPEGVKPDTLFCYDLEVPNDVVPIPGDDECESFELWPIHRVLDVISRTDDFKFNVPLVILDFALRHGILTPENTQEYTIIASSLRQPFPDTYPLGP
ncbi:MAG: DUF4743 domain-containing protein [Rhodospirillaceae bacterium]|nr:DUF4743 domain-containing protein [Rhodospirillaceae bacterium]